MAGKTVRFPRGTLSLLELRSPGSHLVPFSRRSLPVFPAIPFVVGVTDFGYGLSASSTLKRRPWEWRDSCGMKVHRETPEGAA
ncbi:hypothetical protein [Halobacillus yeomjeoni]|uniref:Uncharacterized protein n=1 Tax=Halobacillus yeomjeoni TaxID=311194 RepID=A0A931HTK2_9BACI|nr:hypothetical protein [Halobacillus yeomjeoni]MBH0229001.1 hypothetical protein [Halobacillus yeomjeoni]